MAPSSLHRPVSGGACVPCVRLFADHVVVTSTEGLACNLHEPLVPLVELSFDYGGTRIRASDPRARVFRSGDGATQAIPRNELAEGEARRVMERLGAVELVGADAIAPPAGCEADYVVRADADEHAFCAFTSRALDRWGALGWRVEVDPLYPFRLLERDVEWYARIEPHDGATDWFALELGVEVDGTRIDLLPLLLDVLDRLDPEGGLSALASSCRTTWALRFTETRHLSVPVERLKVLLRVVAELYQGEHSRTAAFPEARMGALQALDEAFPGAGAIQWIDPAQALRRSRVRLAPIESLAAPIGLAATLRPYQAQGVAFLQRLRMAGTGGVLADEMGLGKTLQTIAHVCIEREQGRLDAPVLVVAPTTLIGNWLREVARFAPGLRAVVLHGCERRSRWAGVAQAHVVITTYAVVVRDEDRFAQTPFHLVILDEAQAIKNARSQARRALERIPTKGRIALTGTPVENHTGELWSLFDWLVPGLLGSEVAFRRFWRQPIEERGDNERLVALRELVAPYVLRRLKRDVARELPPKTEILAPVEIGGKQRELYEAIRLAAHADVRRTIRAKGLASSAIAILGALTKLRQICCDPRLLAMDCVHGVRESAKLEALLGMVAEQLSGGHRILVFSQFTSMLALVDEALSDRGIRHLSLTGATRDRQRVVDAFEEGRADVFLISLKAGGTGLNLTSADTVVHYEPWWNPAAQAQATDRTYRIGQRRPVFVHHLYVAGSVEERVLALAHKKRSLSTALFDEGASAGGLSEVEVEALFAPLDPSGVSGPPRAASSIRPQA
jgi:superfamily II DNA or RNA helicase